jgi:hypothetical protein
VLFVIPHPVSSPVRNAGKSTASTPECSQNSVNKSRKLYRDVLKRETTAAPSAAVSDRYEELEQQDPPTEDKRSESFQQQQQRTAEDRNPRISDVTVKYYSQFISRAVQIIYANIMLDITQRVKYTPI